MRLLIVLAAAMMLSACVQPLNYRVAQSPLTLASDRNAPLLALIEYRATRELAAREANPVTICVGQGRDAELAALPAQAEERLMLRLESVAPFDRCRVSGDGHVDAITGGEALVVTAWDLACDGPTCTASAGVQRGPRLYSGSDYDLLFDRYWRISLRDLGIVLT